MQFQIDFEKSPFGRDLTHEEQRILSLLRRGRENANSVKWLASMVGVSQVRLRATVKHLVEHHGYLICSSTGKNPGFYYPQDSKEYKAGVKQYINRIRSLAKRIRAMDKEAYEEIFGQTNILDSP
jgi:hypothetical protein